MHKTFIYGKDATAETVSVVENLSLIKNYVQNNINWKDLKK